MYVPKHFAAPDEGAVRDLLRRHGAADLVTSTSRVWSRHCCRSSTTRGTPARCSGTSPATTTSGGAPSLGEALVIVRGPDAYVSPSWYATKREHGRVVPTWNYVTAHVYGRLVVHDDAAWVEVLVRRLTAQHEASRAEPWSVDDAPPEFIAGQLRAIVGVEVEITRIEAKCKLSQNRPGADRAGVVAGLDAEEATGSHEVAAAMRRVPARD